MTRIVIEGADKKLQIDLLYDQLEKNDREVTKFYFPRYTTSPAGKFFCELLSGTYGDFENSSPYLASLPDTLDRVAAREEIAKATAYCRIGLFDRYTPSSMASQGARISDSVERAQFIRSLEILEYDELKIPAPTLVIYLAISTVFAEPVAQTYRELARTRSNWRIIECMRDGKLRTPENIHQEVWRHVSKHLDSNDITL